MNKLTINNFLNLKKVEIELKRQTILIGPQASGKSVIAKLLYLFYSFPSLMQRVISKDEELEKKELDKNMLNLFRNAFPEYAWGNTSFSIIYKTDTGSMSYVYEKGKTLKFLVTKKYEEIFCDFAEIYKSSKKDKEALLFMSNRFSTYKWGFVNNCFASVCIPSGRSFFLCLERNVFWFLSNDISIDFFMKEFGEIYRRTKWLYENTDSQEAKEEIEKGFRNILHGKYIINTKEKKEYIEYIGDKRNVELWDASSGEQSLIPILMVLGLLKNGYFYVIEEPEAHLFPDTQREVVKYIVSSQNRNSCTASFVTTHSPYILTTFNNLAQAGILSHKFKKNGDESSLRKLNKIVPSDCQIPVGELAAYSVKDGKAENIIDKETGLVNGEVLDQVSDLSNDEFNALLSLEIEK